MKIEVIVPVGPGHEQLKTRALNSVGVAWRYYANQAGDNRKIESIACRAMDDSKGEHGRSAARNAGVQESEADWLFFLDADDQMHPQALVTAAAWLDNFDAVWGRIVELVEPWHVVERAQIPWIHKYSELIEYPPTMTLQMGHFVRRSVAEEFPFNEEMDTGEDFEYYLRIWREKRCIKIDHPFMLNTRGQHSTGPRSATGAAWSETVARMLREARK